MKYLSEFLKYIDLEKNYSNYTLINYKDDLSFYLDFLNKENIDVLDSDYKVIRNYLSYMYNKKYSSKTISRHISSLRSFFKYLKVNNIIDNNPMVLVSNPKLEKRLPKYLNFEDTEKLLNAYSNGLLNIILVWIFVILMGVLDYYLVKYLIKRK